MLVLVVNGRCLEGTFCIVGRTIHSFFPRIIFSVGLEEVAYMLSGKVPALNLVVS